MSADDLARGFAIGATAIEADLLRAWYAASAAALGDCRDVGDHEVPGGGDVARITADPAVQEALARALPGGASLVHQRLHLNPSGAEPLGFHVDTCEPWFLGEASDAPPAVRIWFFPQPVPLNRGPLALVPTGAADADAVVATVPAGGFIVVYDMTLCHRQMPNTSDFPRFMIRAEFNR